jgi:hypothetical protein
MDDSGREQDEEEERYSQVMEMYPRVLEVCRIICPRPSSSFSLMPGTTPGYTSVMTWLHRRHRTDSAKKV